jgi:uncharacterized protein
MLLLLRFGLLTLLAGLIGYLMRARFIALFLRWPQPRYGVGVVLGVHIPITDDAGQPISLATDHYYPRAKGDFPTVIIRSPYGRERKSGAFGYLIAFYARSFAERGYHVLLQDTRGRFDSGGQFMPYFNERADGLATLAWAEQQPWFNGVVGLWGPSYLGITQWAMVGHAPAVKAFVPAVTSAKLRQVIYPDGAFDLGLAMRWLTIFDTMDRTRHNSMIFSAPQFLGIDKKTQPALKHLPISEADSVALAQPVDFYRFWLENTDAHSPIWDEVEKEIQFDQISAPALLVGGWYDFFLRGMLQDYADLRAAGHNPYLTIGPWHHLQLNNPMAMIDSFREGVRWFEHHLKGQPAPLRQKPVRIYIMGQQKGNRWREYDSFPPPAVKTRFFLHAAHGLDTQSPQADEAPDKYRYDPNKPTPALGGTQFSLHGGPQDNRALEDRPDVLTFTTAALENAVTIIGHVRLELYVRSSLFHTDFFGRLCAVNPDGYSVNICDGLLRVAPGVGQPNSDGVLRVEVDMWATAYRFVPGQKMRLQISSGAHPRWSRNQGTGKLIDTDMKRSDQTVYHDSLHPSALLLPVVEE